jgi:hypothetical protein
MGDENMEDEFKYMEVGEGSYCHGCNMKAGEKNTMEYCMKYGHEFPESEQDLIKSIELCIQDKQRYLLLNISRKIAKLDANYEQPK